jgi:hypothetical protein
MRNRRGLNRASGGEFRSSVRLTVTRKSLQIPDYFRIAHVYVSQSQSQQKSTGFLGALRRARNWSDQNLPLRNSASRPMIPASSRTTHPFAV